MFTISEGRWIKVWNWDTTTSRSSVGPRSTDQLRGLHSRSKERKYDSMEHRLWRAWKSRSSEAAKWSSKWGRIKARATWPWSARIESAIGLSCSQSKGSRTLEGSPMGEIPPTSHNLRKWMCMEAWAPNKTTSTTAPQSPRNRTTPTKSMTPSADTRPTKSRQSTRTASLQKRINSCSISLISIDKWWISFGASKRQINNNKINSEMKVCWKQRRHRLLRSMHSDIMFGAGVLIIGKAML